MILRAVLTGAVLALMGWGRLPPLPLLAGSGLLGLLLAWGSRKAGHTHALELVEQTARRSPLAEMSPGAKVLLCLAGLLACVTARSLVLVLLLWGTALGALLGPGGVPLRRYLRLLALPGTFLLLGALALAVDLGPVPGDVLALPVPGGFLSVTEAGQRRTALVTLRAFGGVSWMYALALTTPMAQLLELLQRWKLPKTLVELMFLTYRVPPVGAAGVHVPGRPVPPGLAQFLRRRAHLRGGGLGAAGPVPGTGPAVSGGHGGPLLAGRRVPGGHLVPRAHRPAGPGDGDADGWSGSDLDSGLERRVALMAPVLELRHITCGYDPEEPPALRDVSLALEPGERLALAGPNGAGKSTLLLAALGLLPLSAGEIWLEGRRVDLKKRRELDRLRSSVGLVFQNPDDQLLAPTVEGEAAFGPRNLGLPPREVSARVDRALAACGLEDYRRRSPHQLSGGEKKRTALAGVLAMEPRVLLLDEPAAGLDPEGRRQLEQQLDLLRARGIAVLLSTHDVDFVWRWADRTAVLAGGRLAAAGTPEEIFGRCGQIPGWNFSPPMIYWIGKELGLSPLPRSREELEQRWKRNAPC